MFCMLKKIFLINLFLCFIGMGMATGQVLEVGKLCKQRHFNSLVPAGDYSGITYLGDNMYAVVSDKSPVDGFHVFKILLDLNKGDIKKVEDRGFVTTPNTNRDSEGIVFFPDSNTVFISGEAENSILEYRLDGEPTGRKLNVPMAFVTRSGGNLGLEALAYNAHTHLFWTTSESTLKGDGERATHRNGVKNRLRLQSFNEQLQPEKQYLYVMDAPRKHKKAKGFVTGVPELTALDDGCLLVLERELYIPSILLGANVHNRIYVVDPKEGAEINVPELSDSTPVLNKRLLCCWKTRMNLFSRSFANYEAMCLGPKLHDGRQVLILISDSQHQFAGMLKDWFKSIVLQ